MADTILSEDLVIDRKHGTARISEHDVHTLIHQGLNHHSRSGHLAGHVSLLHIHSCRERDHDRVETSPDFRIPKKTTARSSVPDRSGHSSIPGFCRCDGHDRRAQAWLPNTLPGLSTDQVVPDPAILRSTNKAQMALMNCLWSNNGQARSGRLRAPGHHHAPAFSGAPRSRGAFPRSCPGPCGREPAHRDQPPGDRRD